MKSFELTQLKDTDYIRDESNANHNLYTPYS